MDIATPRNVHLSGFYRRSTAVSNTVEKLPLCIDVILEDLKSRYSEIYDLYGQEGIRELENVMRNILALKEEILNDEPFRKLNSSGPDVSFYNEYLIKLTCQDCRPTFLNTIRLYTECYVFRRIWEAFELTCLQNYMDPYSTQKQRNFYSIFDNIVKTGKYFQNILKYPSADLHEDFLKLVKLNIWSNEHVTFPENNSIIFDASLLNTKLRENKIICNQAKEVWELLNDKEDPRDLIGFFNNNVGFELFMDLCIADYFLTNYCANKIVFFVKPIPWFVLDARKEDIFWLLEQMKQCSYKHMQDLAIKWNGYIIDKRLEIYPSNYFVLPVGFNKMKVLDPKLYCFLKKHKMLVIKGDLNHRKLLEDINWNPLTPFEVVLRDFFPTNIFLMTVIKSNIVCNLDLEVADRITNLNKEEMTCDKLALLQLAKKPLISCDCLKL